MPLQSGSDGVLKAMRRSYRRERYLGIIDRVRAAMPDAAITTDIIVGFPGETEADFEQTLDVVREARFAGAFTFQYSKRPGTPAADAGGPGAARRSSRSATSGWSRCRTRSPGRRTSARSAATLEVLVAEGEGRKDGATHRLSGRARTTGWCTSRSPPDAGRPGPGDVVTVTVSPTPRRTTCLRRPGRRGRTPHPRRRRVVGQGRHAPPAPAGVLLGMPTVGVPAVAAPGGSCS